MRRAFLIALGIWSTLVAAAGPFELISVRDPAQAAPAGGSGDSFGPVVSPDGRYVLFASTANNLVLNNSGNPIPALLPPRINVYLRDRVGGTTTLVSANVSGSGGGNGDSVPTGISSDGRYALFESSAVDLVTGGTNGQTQVYLRDLASNVTFLVSASTNGIAGNGLCRGSTLTPDGRYVAFTSAANDLVPGDTNGIPDVFVRDMQAGLTVLASPGALATNRASLVGSEAPDITPDGRYVAYYSAARNLVTGVTHGGEIYVRDLVAATTTWTSQGVRNILGTSNAVSFNHAISADGQFVVFETCTNPPSPSSSTHGFILRFSLGTGSTDLVNSNAFVQTANAEEIRSLNITPDGRFVSFVANTNLSLGTTCIYLWDAQSGSATLASAGIDGTVEKNSICDRPAVDSSGRFVTFLSSATNLVTNSLAGTYHLYRRDMQAGTTTLIDADTNGVGSSVGPGTAPRMSADGSLVAFESLDGDLVANDRNHAYDVFARDLDAGATELVSAHEASLPSSSANGPNAVNGLCASGDGRFLAFTSDADNLVPDDTNGFRDVFLRDRFLGTTRLVSVATNGAGADGISSEPAISANGRYIAFTSGADNLAPGDANRAQDVFVRDLEWGTTVLVSVKSSGSGSGNQASYSPGMSADGRFVLFRSQATNLASGTFTGTDNLFLRDLRAGVTHALTTGGVVAASMSRDGRFVAFADTAAAVGGTISVWDSLAGAVVGTNSLGLAVTNLAFSPDANLVACSGSNTLVLVDRLAGTNQFVAGGYPSSRTGLRFSADGRFLTYSAAPYYHDTNQVYLYDVEAGSTVPISTAWGSQGGAGGNSDSPEISADGRFVVYRSVATNLVATPNTSGFPDLFLYDRLAGLNTLLTVDRSTGAPADNRSVSGFFSGDGRTLFLQSWASDLIPQDFNQGGDVLALSFLYAAVSTSLGQGPTISWPVRPGESYQVQFKDSLGDASWQEVTGTVSVVGNQAQLTDPAPSLGQRFYRVVAY